MQSKSHMVPAATLQRETVVRKSRFIACGGPSATREQAMTLLARARREHPDARHHCWAYLLGNPVSATSAAMSDDGEPSGTAGRPILSVIQHKGIGDIMVVVTRYFGGIKLGAGGLIRAYAGAAEAVLSALPLQRYEPDTTCTLTLDFAHEQALRHWAVTHGATIDDVVYGQGVRLGLTLPATRLAELEAFCRARGITMGMLS